MRLWTIHPKHLDAKGLVSVWREGLLAQKVLLGKTEAYKNHPQLDRFKNSNDRLGDIGYYLLIIFEEAERRGYSFDRGKIFFTRPSATRWAARRIKTSNSQLLYEWELFLDKVEKRNQEWFQKICNISVPDAHPLFYIYNGDVEKWERVK